MPLQSENEYLALEKQGHENVSMLPSVKKKCLEIAEKIFGTSKNKFSPTLTLLINHKHEELFNK